MPATDVIIIGAGASGLMTARELCRAGLQVVVLEARNRLGGRIHTTNETGFDIAAEAGAEFIHGNLPVTIGLLREADIGYHAIEGETRRVSDGNIFRDEAFIEDWQQVISRMKDLDEDITVADFLHHNFAAEQHSALRDSIRGFVEGYDAGDTYKASTFALRDDLAGMEESEQYRVDGGYAKLVTYLSDQCIRAGCMIRLSAVVTTIKWRQNAVNILTDDHKRYTAKKVVITLPLGVLQAPPGSVGAVAFLPSLPGQIMAVHALGFGAVIKILLQFTEAFWKNDEVIALTGADTKNLGWLFANTPIPTWWTQLPSGSALLTGWLAGPKAEMYKNETDSIIIQEALDSLAAIFKLSIEALNNKVSVIKVFNWVSDPFTRGAYAYSTVKTTETIKILSRPVEDTIFFAGEALHDGPQMATVEGALSSGIKVSKQVLESIKPASNS